MTHHTATLPGFTALRALGSPTRVYPGRAGHATAASASRFTPQDTSVQTKCSDGTWRDCPLRCRGSSCYYDCVGACPDAGSGDAGAPHILER